jgi:signal transduction histidine kinase/ActR/RegA family two-component response regulator
MQDYFRELLEASSGTRLRRYGGVLGAFAVATLLRWLLDPYLGDHRQYLTYIFALVFTSWRYGIVPSLLMFFLGLLAAAFLFTSPRHSLLVLDPHYWAGRGGVFLDGISILLVFGGMGAAHRHAAVSAVKALAKQKELEKEIAQRRLAEEALRQAHDELEHRVEERTSALAHANEALREADRRKDEFLAMLAHELRNPLAPVRNGLYILRMPNADGTTRGRVIEMMEQEVRHLTRMVDDLLDVSRITRGKIQLRQETIDLASAVAGAVEAVRPQMEAQRQELAVALPPEPVYLEADPTRLEQVLSNLLNNAAKYTEPGGRIDVAVERDGGRVVVRVRDTGVGIAAELLPHVFDLFTQGDQSLARSHGGLGIGLTLVRRLVEMMGGTVTAHSEGPGRGSEFRVRLSALSRPARDASKSPNAAGRSGERALRVLVVEDIEDVAEMLATLLGLWGHEARVVPDGPAALLAARTYHPQVVLLDIGLPGLNGYDVARQLRQQAGPEQPLLVAITGYGSEEDHRRSREAGFDHHLVKPVSSAALQAVLARTESLRRGPAAGLALR